MIKNLKYTASALVLAVTSFVTRCGKENQNKTEEEIRNEIYDLERELRKIKEANYEENFEIIHTLSNLPGIDIANYDDGRIFRIEVKREQTEEDFIMILNDLKSSTCYDLQSLTIKNCDLTKYSEETRNLFQEVISTLVTVGLDKLSFVNMNITDISFLSNPNFENSLIRLDLSNNQISDMSILKDLNLNEMEVMMLSSNQIADITNISHLKNISLISLDSNNISDISPLLDLPKLDDVFLGNNNISDFRIGEQLKNQGISVYSLYDQNNPKLEDKELDKEYEFEMGKNFNIYIGNTVIEVETEDGKVKVKVK